MLSLAQTEWKITPITKVENAREREAKTSIIVSFWSRKEIIQRRFFIRGLISINKPEDRKESVGENEDVKVCLIAKSLNEYQWSRMNEISFNQWTPLGL